MRRTIAAVAATVLVVSCGSAAVPSDLVPRGAVRVSRGPITLRGSLKSDTLFVGIVP
jgi:hypothetical protein